jgi:hypothetical protein
VLIETRTPARRSRSRGCASIEGYTFKAMLEVGHTPREIPRSARSATTALSSIARTLWSIRSAPRSSIASRTPSGPLDSPAWTVRFRPALPGKGAPLRQCGRASLLVNLPCDEMPLLIEMILDLGVN